MKPSNAHGVGHLDLRFVVGGHGAQKVVILLATLQFFQQREVRICEQQSSLQALLDIERFRSAPDIAVAIRELHIEVHSWCA